jgi:hypothetical protein
MANTLKTTLVSNLDSVPMVMNDVGEAGGRVRACIGNVSWVSATLTTAGDFMRLCRLPSNARIVSSQFYCDHLDDDDELICAMGLVPIDSDATTSTHTANLAAYGTTAAKFQSDSFGDAASGIDTTVTVTADVANYGKKIHVLAGDTTDPGGMYDLALVVTTDCQTDTTGNVAFRILYTVD